MNRFRRQIGSGFACFAALGFVLGTSGGSFVNFEGKQTSPLRLSPDGSRLFAVNTADNRLSVFDVSQAQNPVLIAEIPVGLEPVSVNPLNNDEAWVVNEVSDSVSIVSVSRHQVTATLYVQDEPADVVFGNGRAFVTASRKNRIAVFDLATRAALTPIPVLGESPRALTVNSNGTKVYAAFALSGNRTTLIPPARAPRQPTETMRADLPTPPQVGLIVDAADPAWTTGVNPPITYTMPDNDVVEIDTETLAVTRYFPRVGTVNFAIAIRPGPGDLYVANTDARNLTHFEPNLRGSFVTNQVSRIDVQSGKVTRFDLNGGFDYTTFPNLRDKTNALAQPAALAFWPGGNYYFLAAFGSDRIAVVDADTGAVRARVELNPAAAGSGASSRTMRGPRGLAFKPWQALYVLNRIANTLTIVDPINPRVLREIPVGSHDPTPPAIREGRGFLYDAKLSGNGTVSCASCHIDAEMDHLAWDLGDPQGALSTNRTVVPQLGATNQSVAHPMKGPMTTQTLRGLNGLDPLHWRGDRTNFLHFNGAFDSLLGGAVLSASDMEAYRAFVNTMVFQPNPNQNLDRTLPTTFANGGNPRAGLNNFTVNAYQPGLTCNTCHSLPTGSARFIVPGPALQESQDFKIPHLRNVYQKMSFTNTPGAQSIAGFGLVHDGSDPSLFAFLSRPVFGVFANNTAVKNNLSAFVQCLDTGTAPAVGYGRTLTEANVDAAAMVTDWSLLEAQAAAGNIDLILKGTVDGRLHGFLYQASSNQYLPDSIQLPHFTRAQLRAKVLSGDTLTILGAPPGLGRRLGIDRNEDGILDGDQPAPVLRITSGDGVAVVAWTTNAPGYLLEKSATLPPAAWSPDTHVRGISGGEFSVTNSVGLSNLFFRLREL